MDKPMYNSYHVEGNIFAGEYPGDKNEEKAKLKIKKMIEFGVRHFIDLTEEHELKPYSHLLPRNTSYKRFPIRDCSIPEDIDSVESLMDYIKDLNMSDDGFVYIHCWGGVGRTGTIIGCYLAKDSYGSTMYELEKRFSQMPKSEHRKSPETKEQEDFIKHFIERKLENKIKVAEIIKDRVRGSLIAGAVGDALGYSVEFMNINRIIEKYGKDGISMFELDQDGQALVSDDTQMTLFTANGMLMGLTRGAMRGIGGRPENYVDGAYLDWYYTQTGKKKEVLPNDFHYTWLRDLPELSHNRAPGNTCLSACESLLHHKEVKNNSKGCGGIKRVAPMGLLAATYQHKTGRSFYDMKELAEAGSEIAKVTHKHPLGYLPASLLTLLLYRILPLPTQKIKLYVNKIIQDCLEIMLTVEGNEHQAEKEYLKKLTNEAIRLAQTDISDYDAIPKLGEGWVAEEAWAISLYCVLRHIDNPKEAILAAVNHSGDSDSTGSITGNIMGAIHGYYKIQSENLFCPDGRKLKDILELHNIIMAIADDLYSGCIISEYDSINTHEKKQWYERYCEMKPTGII